MSSKWGPEWSALERLQLNEAEKKLLAKTREGEIAYFGDKIPASAEERNARTIRADVIRLLMLVDDGVLPASVNGVRIEGAAIDGPLNLQGCTLRGNLSLIRCDLGKVNISGCRAHAISFDGSHCSEISAVDADIRGSVHMRKGFISAGEVKIVGTKIAGSLDCAGGEFLNRRCSPRCVSCYVEGNIVLRDGFNTSSLVSLYGSTVTGDVNCIGGTFGSGRASGAAPPAEGQIRDERPCLIITNMKIEGTLVLEEQSEKCKPKTRFFGGIDLTGARITRLVDEITEHTRRRDHISAPTVDKCPTFLNLAGLSVGAFANKTDVSGKGRIAFLKLQRAEDMECGFKPQPWVQMVKVLREAGHIKAARKVAIAYEKARTRGKDFGGWWARAAHWLYGLLVGYGHRPGRLIGIMTIVWLLLGGVYYVAATRGVFAPNAVVPKDAKYAQCRIGDQNEKLESSSAGNWHRCHTAFNPLLYSLDLILPLVDLHQKKNWVPVILTPPPYEESKRWFRNLRPRLYSTRDLSDIVRVLMWFEILFGWGASFLLAAVLSGLAKRMD
jgi:hypothetical protein